MPLIPKITTYSTQIIPTMYQDGWRLISIYDDKMFWEKEEKKQVKSRALTTESNKGIAYLRMQRDNIDKGLAIHIPDFVTNEKEWNKFINHYTQKNSEDSKMHAEKQKTFDIRARWANWEKDKPKTNSNTIG